MLGTRSRHHASRLCPHGAGNFRAASRRFGLLCLATALTPRLSRTNSAERHVAATQIFCESLEVRREQLATHAVTDERQRLSQKARADTCCSAASLRLWRHADRERADARVIEMRRSMLRTLDRPRQRSELWAMSVPVDRPTARGNARQPAVRRKRLGARAARRR